MSNSCCFEGIFALLFSSTILISIFLFNANLSMMNIRDFIFINKAKSPNKIRILDILGFDTNADLSHSPEIVKEINENLITSDIESEEILIDHQNNTEFYPLLESELEQETSIEQAPTNTFEPINITSQIKKIWTDIESRRQWVVPAVLITVTIVLIVSATGIFINNRNRQNEIINLYETLTKESNELINTLPEIITISTDNFYSKYDVSNSSANLQLIESTIMEYQRNLQNRDDLDVNNNLNNNLNNVFTLVNDLDKLISYRILLSEILIYEDLLIISDDLDIELLSNQLSEISATSKLNYEKLTEISEYTKHTLLVGETLKSAEDLHGRLIASLRNNETDVSNALLIAINMNKEIEQNSFNDALEIFKINKTNLYNSLDTLP